MASAILNKLRRRQSSSLPLRTQHAQSYIHHSSTPPDWPTKPAQATPDVYITSPPEDDGLLTSVCVHRAVEHEPKRLRKNEDHAPPVAPVLPTATSSANDVDVEGPPVFGRSSLQAADVVLPKKPSEIAQESSAKWARILDRQAPTDKGVQGLVETTAVMSGVDFSTSGHVQWEGGHELARVTSSRDQPGNLTALPVPKQKDTLRRRASKVFKSLTNRDSLTFGSGNSDKRLSHTESRTGTLQQKRRNTLSNDSRPFSIWTKTATAHAMPVTTADDSAAKPDARTGRRRSSTIGHVDRTERPTSPPLPSLPVPEVQVNEGSPATESPTNEAVLPLAPPLEIAEPASKSISDAPKSEKPRKLQSKRSKNTFSHLFTLKGEKQFRSPPPAKQEDVPVPPVPVIPHELAKAVADPDTPEVAQTPTFASPASTAATPKSTKSKRFKRHRRATISSMSQSQISTDVMGTPSSMSTVPQADTPKTPSSLRSHPFSIIDLRKGFSMRSLGKGKGKLFSAKSSPATSSPPPPVPKLFDESELPATVMQRYKMSRPPPLQSSDSPQQDEPVSASVMGSPTTVEFQEATGTPLPSPTESEGPVTPMFGADVGSTPALALGLALAPAIELDESKRSEEGAPELSFTPPTSEESEEATRVPAVSEVTIVAEDPMFGVFDEPSSIGDLQLQLREPSTKTSTLDAHLRIGSLRFDNFSFDTDGF